MSESKSNVSRSDNNLVPKKERLQQSPTRHSTYARKEMTLPNVTEELAGCIVYHRKRR